MVRSISIPMATGDPGDLFFDAGRGSALINNGGDNVTLYDPSNDEFVQATYNGDALDDPTLGASGYSGFSATATRNGTGEDLGNDTDGQSLQRTGDGADTFASKMRFPARHRNPGRLAPRKPLPWRAGTDVNPKCCSCRSAHIAWPLQRDLEA